MSTEQQLFVIQVSGGRFRLCWADHETAPPDIDPRVKPHRNWKVIEDRCLAIFKVMPKPYGVTH